MSKLYTVMKNNEKIKTARSLNAAKEIADQEQAEVFCDGECVYSPSKQVSQAQEDQAQPTEDEPQAAEKPTIEDRAESKPAIEEKAAKLVSEKPAKKVIEEEPLLQVALQTQNPKGDFYVLTSLMNVREKPSFDAKKLRTAPRGTKRFCCSSPSY